MFYPSVVDINLPSFNHIMPDEIQHKLAKIIEENLSRLETDDLKNPIELCEQMEDKLQRFWSPIAHLHSVKSTEALRKAYADSLLLLSDYESTLSHHPKLYQAFREYSPQNHEEARIQFLKLRDFHLSGADLPDALKKQIAEIEKKLSQLSTAFSENILDATQSFEYRASDEELKGVPQHLIPSNNVLTLDFPCYSAIQQYADDRNLREKIYKAYHTRASELGKAQYDNSTLMFEILQLKQLLSELLSFQHYAEMSLQTKMAKTPEEVLHFLDNLLITAKSHAEKELEELVQYAGVELSAWDVSYYARKLKQSRFGVTQESFRPYFKTEKVLSGLFQLVSELYQINIQKRTQPTDVWHDSVVCYEILDNQQQCQGIFYIDLYTRKNKRQGAWMDDFCSRYLTPENHLQIPVAFLTCNFLSPDNSSEKTDSGMTHDDVMTLFHEFGHVLHHLMTRINKIDIAGIHGVPWDFVEMPSQFMENFCWEKNILKLISENRLPDELIEKLWASRHFHAGLQLVRQLEFALFDFHLHLNKPKSSDVNYVMEIYNKIHQKAAVIKTPDTVRFPHTFSHIFDGGYAAAYYSYLWAEVIACDVYSAFEETDSLNLNVQMGLKFLDKILSRGGSEDPSILFRDFRGRDPEPKAFLKSWGLQ